MHRKLILVATVAVLFACCKKNNSNKTTSCSSTIHGFTISPDTGDTASINIAHHGVVSVTTGAMATAGTFRNCIVFASQGAFNSGDNNYYVFRKFFFIDMLSPEEKYSTLYKIDAAGGYSKLFAADTTAFYTSAVYNKALNKLFCVRNDTQICELTPGAGTYAVSNIVTPSHVLLPEHYSSTNIAVDNSTGNMFFVTGDTGLFYIEKLAPGSTSTVPVAMGSNGRIIEMRFNKNDGKLYGLKAHGEASYEFVRIDPAAGIITSVSTLPFVLNPDFYSATLDPCSNRYLLATGYHVNTPILAQFDMGGILVKMDSTGEQYQGLTVDY